MLHQIPVDDLGPRGDTMARAVSACVHCGFCLPACPTYQLLQEEMDSPRGRIFLIKDVLEGAISPADAAPYLDRCLGCVSCVTACPSAVQYGHLLTSYRGWAESQRRRSIADRIFRRAVLSVLSSPSRTRRFLRVANVLRKLVHRLPRRPGQALQMMPRNLPPRISLQAQYPAQGNRRGRVALLAGCAQQVFAPQINLATIEVLSRNGVDVLVPPQQVCCGALAAHTGDLKMAARLARRNLRRFPRDVDAIVTNAAGCGSGMQEYGVWLKGTQLESSAAELGRRTVDVSAYLHELGPLEPVASVDGIRSVAYHDACHLAHAQKVVTQPRRLLSFIPDLQLLEIAGAEHCCGSAGIYSLEQPELASQLGKQMAGAVIRTGADAVVSGNIGCIIQLRHHLAQMGCSIPVYHTMELLQRAYNGGRPS